MATYEDSRPTLVGVDEQLDEAAKRESLKQVVGAPQEGILVLRAIALDRATDDRGSKLRLGVRDCCFLNSGAGERDVLHRLHRGSVSLNVGKFALALADSFIDLVALSAQFFARLPKFLEFD